MAQPPEFSKNPLNINPFWERASAEPLLERTKWAAILEMAVFAKDGIEIRNLLRARPTLVEPAEPVYEIEITGEADAQRKNREVCNQEKRVGWENHVIKARERGVLCNSFRWDEADAKVRSYLFLCLGAEGQHQIQQKRPNMQLHTVSTQQFMTVLEEIFVMTRIIAFERYNFICRKQKETESLEQFHADLVELASQADCGDRESEWVRDMFTAHMNNEKIAEELLVQTRTPQEAYEYAIRRKKGIEHSRTMKINPIGGQTVTTPKQEPKHYVNTRGRQNQQYNQNNQRGRGNFRGRTYPRGSQNTRGQQYQQQHRNTNPKQCFKCGNQYGPNHLQSCPAKDKICSKCAKCGNFAKVCRSTNVNYLGNINEEQQEETKIESTGTYTEPVAYAEFTTNNGWENYQVDDFSVMAISESFEI